MNFEIVDAMTIRMVSGGSYKIRPRYVVALEPSMVKMRHKLGRARSATKCGRKISSSEVDKQSVARFGPSGTRWFVKHKSVVMQIPISINADMPYIDLLLSDGDYWDRVWRWSRFVA